MSTFLVTPSSRIVWRRKSKNFHKMSFKTILALTLVGLAAAQWDPNFAPNRSSIVHLFEWTWNDIAEECETFLDPFGYGGVQTSPVTENAVVTGPWPVWRPWWERYQPVSYNVLTTRSGTEQQFADMVRRCNAVGVRVYVDAVINHMTGNQMAGQGTGGSPYDATRKNFPEYSGWDFNGPDRCWSENGRIGNYSNHFEVRNCELEGLTDLDQGSDYVRNHTSGLLNKLIGYGVAGFRIDASKHMWPEDMEEIFNRLDNLSTQHGFPAGAKPFIFQEVIEQDSEPIKGREYFHLGRVTEFKYGKELGGAFRGRNPLRHLWNWGEGSDGWGLYPDGSALVFIDNHDNQRGHGGGGDTILTFRQDQLYKMATAFMLAHPYGVTRVMSSYFWEERCEDEEDKNDWIGPPSDADGNTLPVIRNPNLTCGNGWICEHRWRQIYNMVQFRNVVAGAAMGGWWSNDNNQIAFCRVNKGFIAINGDNYPLNAKISTCLPAGQYCDVISGNKVNNACTGKTISVGTDGLADIFVNNERDSDDWDPIVAIHAESKL